MLGEGLREGKCGAVRCFVAKDKEGACRNIALHLVQRMEEHRASGAERPFVLGLATGSTPIPIYRELARLHKEGKVSFKGVISINLDEYSPIQPEDENSYHRFMNENFFQFVDFAADSNFLPDGTLKEDQIASHCEEYEARIKQYGIDIQLLGIGRSGHIGFNEPGSSRVRFSAT